MKYFGTIGPACADPVILKKMVEEGMTGIRVNLSHGSLAARADWIRMIREAGIRDILIDLVGPELRITGLKEPMEFETGSDCSLPVRILPKALRIHEENAEDGESGEAGNRKCFKPGQEILLDDGKILLEVTAECTDITGGGVIQCRVLRGGTLLPNKSIALPGIAVDTPTLTEADRENISHAAEYGVTGVMLPFVRGRQDILNLKKELAKYDDILIFAKIENMSGVEHLQEFIDDVDHVVIARGDLGNAMPLWELPGVQKKISRLCRERHVPFMVVTQMLDSMTQKAVPTRAEVSDIYNAVLDGASSVMVTGETAAGSYPVEVMRYLVKTAECAREDLGK